jgi:hypothetical protein
MYSMRHSVALPLTLAIAAFALHAQNGVPKLSAGAFGSDPRLTV